MLVIVKKDHDEVSKEAAKHVAALIRKKPDCVLGLATGNTPFNLDEYVGLPPEHKESYHYFMWENLFKHINIDRRSVYIPHGMANDIDTFCEWYEKKIKEAGGIDLQVLGIGKNGHIAFNEPGSKP